MIGKKDIEIIRNKIAVHEPPVLSMYVDIDPSKPENARKGWQVRVKNTLKELDISKVVEEAVWHIVEKDRPSGKTCVIFGAEKGGKPWVEDFTLQVELPVVDLAHGRVEARWGYPYIAPLAYALDEYERYGVVFINKKRWRLFEVFLGEIEEIMDVFNEISIEEWHRISADSPSLRFSASKPASSRAGAAVDRFKKRMDAWTQRFYKNVARLLERFIDEHDIHRIILMGVAEETKFFEQYLARGVRDKVVAHLASPPSSEASLGEVAKRVFEEIDKIEREKGIELLNQIREQPGIWGLSPVLEAVQMGRLYVIAVPWDLNEKVWKCADNDWLFAEEPAAKSLCKGEIRLVGLRDVIVDLAAAYGARLEFLRGKSAEMLKNEMAGIAGLARW